MLMSRHQNVGQNHDIGLLNIANKYFENVAEFKYLPTTVTNQNYSEVRRRLNLGDACYH
jgi:hypothetical protein